MRYVGFIGPSYTVQSRNVDCQRCMNLVPELNALGTGKEKEVGFLFGTPGLLRRQTLPDGPLRSAHTATDGKLYVVARNKFYRVEEDDSYVELGTLISTTGRVIMESSEHFVVICDGQKGYRFRLADSNFAEITDEAYTQYSAPTHVGYLDGRFVFFVPGTQTTFISQTDDVNEITFDATEFTSIDATPDKIVAMIISNREISYIKEKHLEIWYNAGGAQYPYSRIDGAFSEIGTIAPYSVASINGIRCWLGRTKNGQGGVYMAEGYQPVRVSTQAIDAAIQKYPNIADATAYTYESDGHFYYVLNFTEADATWVFDLTTKLWHERAYTRNGQLERHRADCHAFAYGRHYVGDYANANLYELSETTFTDDGSPISRIRVAPHVTAGDRRIFYSTFLLDIEAGVGLDGVGQGTDPKVILQFSDDGGHAWKNEIWGSMGKIGERRRRVKWERLGNARDRVFRVTVTDPVRVVLLGAELEFTVGGK